MQFTGRIQAKMDAKGRLFFPSEFRKQLGGGEQKFVLKPDVFQPCLVVYPFETWNAELEQLRSRLNRWNREEAMLLRQFMADVVVFTLDGNGRFLIPKRYIELCGEDKAVDFIGLDDRIEIWASRRTQEPFLSAQDFSEGIERAMKVER